jgi:hypothetical protein
MPIFLSTFIENVQPEDEVFGWISLVVLFCRVRIFLSVEEATPRLMDAWLSTDG